MSADAAVPAHDGARKAAALLIAMGRPLAQRMVSRLDEGELRAIARSARDLPEMNRAVVEALVEEFAGHFVETVVNVPPGAEIGAIFAEGLGEDAARRIAEPPAKRAREPLWPAIADAPPERLGAALGGYGPDAIAAALRQLPRAAAGRVLGAVDPALRAAVARAALENEAAHPAMLQLLEEALHAALSGDDGDERRKESRKQVAAMLNGLEREAARGIIAEIAVHDAAEAAALDALLFDFADLAGLDQAARVTLCDGIGVDVIVIALSGCEGELREAVLGALSARTRRMAEAELQTAANHAPERIREARRTIADAALALAEAGKISLNGGGERV